MRVVLNAFEFKGGFTRSTRALSVLSCSVSMFSLMRAVYWFNSPSFPPEPGGTRPPPFSSKIGEEWIF